MKILKKINKGLILTIIVLLTLTIYLVNVEKQRNEEKDDIKKACEEFIDFTDKYLVLPEEMQTLDNEISEKEEEKHINKIKEELEKLMISNEEAVKIQHQFLVATLKNGYKSNEIKSKMEREITKITDYEFDGNQVTVTFNSNVKNNVKYINEENEIQERQDTFSTTYDEIMLQKIDGKWKIVYSNLQYDSYGVYYEDTMY